MMFNKFSILIFSICCLFTTASNAMPPDQSSLCKAHLERVAKIVKRQANRKAAQTILDRQLEILSGPIPTTGTLITRWEVALHLVGESFNDKTQLTMDSRGEALELIHRLVVNDNLDPYLQHVAEHVHSSMVSTDKYLLPTPPGGLNTPTHLTALMVAIDRFRPGNLQVGFLAMMSPDAETRAEGEAQIANALVISSGSQKNRIENMLGRIRNRPVSPFPLAATLP